MQKKNQKTRINVLQQFSSPASIACDIPLIVAYNIHVDVFKLRVRQDCVCVFYGSCKTRAWSNADKILLYLFVHGLLVPYTHCY